MKKIKVTTHWNSPHIPSKYAAINNKLSKYLYMTDRGRAKFETTAAAVVLLLLPQKAQIHSYNRCHHPSDAAERKKETI
jgi:hypothetical protein